MRNAPAVLSAFALLGCALSRPAGAEVIFYNGEFMDRSNLSCERNTNVADSRVYENFHISGTWEITELFGSFMQQQTTTSLSTAYYEVRQGLSPGNGGTLVGSGHLNVSRSFIAQSAWNWPVYRVSGTPANLVLGTGDYWMTLAPEGKGNGQWFVMASTGANAVGSTAMDGISYWDSTTWNVHWAQLPNGYIGPAVPISWSLGVAGNKAEAPVPEPGSVLLLVPAVITIGGASACRKLGVGGWTRAEVIHVPAIRFRYRSS